MLAFYRALTVLLSPLLGLYLRYRRSLGKEDVARQPERRGVAVLKRPIGPLLWLHGASVGEALSVLPLIERLLSEQADLHILLTTGTVTSAKLMDDRLPPRAVHQYVPIDQPRSVNRFLNHWQPDLAVWIESEIWPNLISATAERDIPLLLIQGRLSERSYRRWARIPSLARRLIQCFDVCMAQDQTTAERYRRLGALDTRVVGNLKDAAPPLPVDQDQLSKLQAAIGDRPCWVAASTHTGEEEAIAAATLELKKDHPSLLTIVAPRHPVRGAEAARALLAGGLSVVKRTNGLPEETTDIYLCDTIGELGLCYRLAEIAFIGGSLVPHGGHNAMEAARLGCAILHGPHIENFQAMVTSLHRAKAAIKVADAKALAGAVAVLLDDETQRRQLAERAASVAERGAEAIVEIHKLIASRVFGERQRETDKTPQHARA